MLYRSTGSGNFWKLAGGVTLALIAMSSALFNTGQLQAKSTKTATTQPQAVTFDIVYVRQPRHGDADRLRLDRGADELRLADRRLGDRADRGRSVRVDQLQAADLARVGAEGEGRWLVGQGLSPDDQGRVVVRAAG